MAKRSDVEPLIIQAWLNYLPAGERKEGNVIQFYGWLSKHMPELLSFRAIGDKYQVLKTILRMQIEY